MQQGVVFYDVVRAIPFYLGHFGTVGAVGSSYAGNPDGMAGQGPLQRFYFTEVAALLTQICTFIKGIRAVLRYKILQGRCLGVISSDGLVILAEGTAPGAVGFGKEAAGIQGKNFDIQVVIKNKMGNGLVFPAKAGAENDLAGKGLGQCLQGVEGWLLIGELGNGVNGGGRYMHTVELNGQSWAGMGLKQN